MKHFLCLPSEKQHVKICKMEHPPFKATNQGSSMPKKSLFVCSFRLLGCCHIMQHSTLSPVNNTILKVWETKGSPWRRRHSRWIRGLLGLCHPFNDWTVNKSVMEYGEKMYLVPNHQLEQLRSPSLKEENIRSTTIYFLDAEMKNVL